MRFEPGKKRCVNIIVAQKAKNTTCQIGEFLSQNLPNWQVFDVFKAMRNNYLTEVIEKNTPGGSVFS
jgi:hypothetical protein